MLQDHLVGAGEERFGHGEAECLGSISADFSPLRIIPAAEANAADRALDGCSQESAKQWASEFS